MIAHRATVLLTCVMLAALVTPKPIQAVTLFREDFEGSTLDTTKWSLDVGDGQLALVNGSAVLTCSGGTFPFLVMKQDLLPTSENFSVTIGLSYPSVTGLGVGVSPLVGEVLLSPVGLYLWQDTERTHGLVASAGDAYEMRLFESPTTAHHVFQWSFIQGTCLLTVDDVLYATPSYTTLPTRLGFGHPHPVSFAREWSTLAVDFIEVQLLGATQTRAASWGSIKTSCP
jgi:hypothetical protein